MKITTRQLRQIIAEEVQRVIGEAPGRAPSRAAVAQYVCDAVGLGRPTDFVGVADVVMAHAADPGAGDAVDDISDALMNVLMDIEDGDDVDGLGVAMDIAAAFNLE